MEIPESVYFQLLKKWGGSDLPREKLGKKIEQKDPNFIQKINFFPPKFKKTIEE